MFTVQYTNSAFNGNQDVPESQWRDHSNHKTYSKTQATIRQLIDAMRERCGTGWDSNYRIISDCDTALKATFLCDGYFNAGGSYESCPHWAERTIRWTWEEGPEPPHPDANGYDGWKYIPIEIVKQTGPAGDWGLHQCPSCIEAERLADDERMRSIEPDWDIITVQDIAREFGITTRRARALAKNRHERFGVGQQLPGGQWVFRPEDLHILAPDPKHRRK